MNGKQYYTVRLNQEVKSGAWVWIEFLAKFNGQCYIPEQCWSTNEDSSGNARVVQHFTRGIALGSVVVA